MTDIETNGEDVACGASTRPSIARFTQIGAAAVSLALIAGIGAWGYTLVVRDVHGVPVVQAGEGAMRLQPESPGGRPAAHQGLAVNAVAAQGTAAPLPDQVVLAPAGASLAEEDLPQARLAAEVSAPAAAPEDGPSPALLALADRIAEGATPFAPIGETAPQEVRVSLGGMRQAPAVAEAPASEEPAAAIAGRAADDGAAMDEVAEDEPKAPAEDAETAPLADAAGVQARSLRPQSRPGGLRTASLPMRSDAVPATGDTVAEADPAELPPGTRLVQLGAYESAEVARSEWGRLDGRFGSYLEGKTRVVERAQSGGRTFWRLRAMGFEDLADARRFCAALMAEGADCIPVVTR